MCVHTAAKKSLFPVMVSAVLPLQRYKWAQGSLRDALYYCITHVQGGNASADGAMVWN